MTVEEVGVPVGEVDAMAGDGNGDVTGTDGAALVAEPEADALLARLGRLRERVALLVAQRSATDPTATDPLRGLYLSGEAVEYLLLRSPEPAPPARKLAPDRTDRLAALRLTDLDTALLLIALAPDLDRTFEPLYGYLNDDVSRRRATVGLALDLCGIPAHRAEGRARFHPTAPLSALGLLTVEEPERPFLSRALRVPDRIVAHLLGDDTPDAALAGHLHPLATPRTSYDAHDGQDPGGDDEFTHFVDRLAVLLAGGPPLAVYLRERHEGDGLVCVSAALDAAGVPAVRFSGPVERVPELLREARLGGRTVVVSGLPDQPGALVRALTDAADVSVVFAAARPYDPQWCESDPLILEAPRQRAAALRAWTEAVGEDSGFDVRATVAPYHL
ncbi:ATP-binding protein, partial [Streptomyces sp. W16]|nr:ATP-binding protein [Streptomyces sp. W16]